MMMTKSNLLALFAQHLDKTLAEFARIMMM